MAKIPTMEQETIINISRANDIAEIYTSDTRWMTKLDKKVEQNPDEWKYMGKETNNGDLVSKTYECPVNLISIRTETRKLSEEQKKKRAEHFKAYRDAQDQF